MRWPEGGATAGLRTLALLVLLAALVASGCSRLTFVRPDLTRGDFTRTAPEVNINTDARGEHLAVQQALAQGQAALGKGDLDTAAASAAQALRIDEGSAAAHTLAGVVADRAGRSADAGKHYRRAVEVAPARGGMHNNYGTWLCGNGRERESLKWFQQAVSAPRYENRAVALANAGACAQRAGMPEEAGAYLEAALKGDPGNPVALAAMAEREFEAGRYMQARAFSQRRLDAARPDPAALLLASQIEEKLGDKDAAAGYVQRLRAEFPGWSGSVDGDHGRR